MSEQDKENIRTTLKKSFDDLISILGTLAHPKRLKILIKLLDNPHDFKTLLQETKLKKSALFSHLNQLKEKTLINSPSHGQYELTNMGRRYLHGLAFLVGESQDLEISLQRTQVARSFLERK